MAQHAILTNKSNQRIAAAIAASGLVGAGLVVPFAQVALAGPFSDPCTITSDGSNPASAATLRAEIDAAIANVNCSVVEINNSTNAPLDLEVEGDSIYVGPAAGLTSEDPRSAITIKSTTGLNISPADGFSGTLMRLQRDESWSWYSSSSTSCPFSAPESCESTSFSSGESGNSSFTNITIEGLTFRDSDLSAIDGLGFDRRAGGAILEIKNSRFVNNNQSSQFSSENGGAIDTAADVVISNSSFVGNYALAKGGAIRTYATVSISNSLFVANSTYSDGGAVYAGVQLPNNGGDLAGDIYSVNSSFVANTAPSGGALFNYLGDTELVLNTFFGNEGSTGAYSQEAVFQNATTKLWGNIFGNYDWTVAQEVDELSEDLGYNIYKADPVIALTSTTSRSASLDEFAFVHDLSNEEEGEAYEDLIGAHAAESSPVTSAPAFRITSSSVAADFVIGSFPNADFNDFFTDKVSVDQLGNPRTLPFAAGAHHVSYVEPEVRDRTNNQTPVVVAPTPKETMVPGFAANSSKLTKPMKKEIRQFLKANPNLKNVVCKGYTSSPSTPQDRTLARKRGKATCDYILTLRPDAKVSIRSGSHTNKPGSQIRRVEIKLS